MYTHAGAAYAAGHIFFLRQNTLMAQPFDPKRLVFTSDASPVADPVLEDTGTVSANLPLIVRLCFKNRTKTLTD